MSALCSIRTAREQARIGWFDVEAKAERHGSGIVRKSVTSYHFIRARVRRPDGFVSRSMLGLASTTKTPSQRRRTQQARPIQTREDRRARKESLQTSIFEGSYILETTLPGFIYGIPLAPRLTACPP
jgi:hypothetical protein